MGDVISELDDLRALARARQRAAGSKISRLRRGANIELAGSEHDPRRDADLIKRYNRRQLQSYIAKLDSFTSRSNSFVRGNNGVALSGEAWKRYKSLERQFNKRVDSHNKNVLDVVIADKGMTIRQRKELMVADRLRAAGSIVNAPMLKHDRQSKRIVSNKALKDLTKDIQARLKPDYLETRIKKARFEYYQMLDTIGSPELKEMSKNLTDFQFSILWNDVGFSTDISGYYENIKLAAAGKRDAARDSVIEDYRKDAEKLIKWAYTLESPAGTKKGARKRKR